MIKLIDDYDNSYEKFCEKDACGVRAFSFYKTYGTKTEYASFWCQRSDSNEITAFISCIDKIFTVCCSDSSDTEEISAFAKAVKCRYLLIDDDYESAFESPKKKKANIMLLEKDSISACNDSLITSLNSYLPEMYNILDENNKDAEFGRSFKIWNDDMELRIEKGTSETAVTFCDGIPASCAAVLSKTENKGLLGAVATKEQFRMRGLAKHTIAFLAQNNKNRDLFIFCKNDKIAFYENLNFKFVSRSCETEFI